MPTFEDLLLDWKDAKYFSVIVLGRDTIKLKSMTFLKRVLDLRRLSVIFNFIGCHKASLVLQKFIKKL